MKQEALKLADELLRDNTQLSVESAYMIRRLVDRIAELEKYEQQIKQMERAYDAHFKKAMGLNNGTS